MYLFFVVFSVLAGTVILGARSRHAVGLFFVIVALLLAATLTCVIPAIEPLPSASLRVMIGLDVALFAITWWTYRARAR